MLPQSAFRPRHRNSGKADEARRCPRFLQWLRGRPCLIGGTCAGRIEAAHVDYAGGKGMSIKVADRYAVPMCSAHHGEQHLAGVKTFEARHKVSLIEAANEYWKRWPGRRAWEDRHAG